MSRGQNCTKLLTSLQSNNKFNVTINKEALETTQQVTHFSDQSPQWDYQVDSMPDATYSLADTNDADLGNFFSRPIKVASYSWDIGTTFFQVFDPWTLFFQNARVLNRVANYELLRCKLKCRILINGNGFHYGRAIASYLPQHLLDDFTQDRGYVRQDIIAASQRPHVYLDPTNSQGGTLSLPFFHHSNALRVPFQEWNNMGEVFIHEMSPLKHANGADDSVTVSVFVWAEEVSLSIPTSSDPPALVAQSGDEYAPGPISRVANSIMRAANKLTDIPVISPYAKATSLAAGATASIASLFGYSRPVNVETSTPFVPHLIGNLANTNVKDSSTKLTLDLKQELTVDPRTMGLGDVDEMTISSISQRQSYLTNFGWQVSDTSETQLWNCEVNPVVWDALNDEQHLTACAFAALPFKWWRGTMKYRFQIVASAFHKGRLKIVYDPEEQVTNEYNTNYTYIIDLAKERDFTVDIGWGQATPYLRHAKPGVDDPIFDTVSLNPIGLRNGIITVYVVNELTVPNSVANNDIEVNVFVSTGDDFEVAEPDSSAIEDYVYFDPTGAAALASPPPGAREVSMEEFNRRRSTAYIPSGATRLQLESQSGEEPAMANHPDSDLTERESEPMKEMASEQMAASISPTDATACIFFGDPVVSFRQCLKRYNYHSAAGTGGNSIRWFIFNNSDFPYYRGYAPDGVNLTDTPIAATPYNYCKMTLLNYLTPAFTARRGGLRWKYMRSIGNLDDSAYMAVSRISGDSSGYSVTEILPTTGNSPNTAAYENSNIWSHMWDGGVATAHRQNPVLEFEVPFYQPFRWASAKNANLTSAFSDFGSFHRFATMWGKNGAEQSVVHRLVATGEDFTLAFYTGPPVMYYVARGDDPVPVED